MFFRGILLCTYIILLYISTFFKLGHRVFIKMRKSDRRPTNEERRGWTGGEIERKKRKKKLWRKETRWCPHFSHSAQFQLFVCSCKTEEIRERVRESERECERARMKEAKKRCIVNYVTRKVSSRQKNRQNTKWIGYVKQSDSVRLYVEWKCLLRCVSYFVQLFGGEGNRLLLINDSVPFLFFSLFYFRRPR